MGTLVDSDDEGNLLGNETRNMPKDCEKLLIKKTDLYRKS
tara:strand:- start:571 stop:690 length:120 start_codon:yes stop_codon:yes gene_type:complete